MLYRGKLNKKKIGKFTGLSLTILLLFDYCYVGDSNGIILLLLLLLLKFLTTLLIIL